MKLQPSLKLFFIMVMLLFGLAMATAMSGTLNAILLYQRLHKQGVYKMSKETILFNGKVTIAAIVMGISIYWLNTSFIWEPAPLLERIYMLTCLVALGILV